MSQFRAPFYAIFVAVMSLIAVACAAASEQPAVEAGAADLSAETSIDRAEPNEPEPDVTPTTTRLIDAPPTSQARPEAAAPETPPAAEPPDRSNNSDPSTRLGAVCWSMTELIHFFLDQLPEVAGIERPAAKHRDFDEALESAQSVMEPAFADGRPMEEASEFVEEFLVQLDAVERQAGGKSISGNEVLELAEKHFSFGDYPGYKEFEEAAVADPTCRLA